MNVQHDAEIFSVYSNTNKILPEKSKIRAKYNLVSYSINTTVLQNFYKTPNG